MTVGSAHAHSSSQAGFGPALIQKASGIKVHLSSTHTAVLFVLHGLSGGGGVHPDGLVAHGCSSSSHSIS